MRPCVEANGERGGRGAHVNNLDTMEALAALAKRYTTQMQIKQRQSRVCDHITNLFEDANTKRNQLKH